MEGRNQVDWEKEYPETTEMIKRSFKEDYVQGFFKFFDKDKKERQRYAVRVHVPGTPSLWRPSSTWMNISFRRNSR